jgi:ribosomal protein S18 acetylase RimI-like enzyme
VQRDLTLRSVTPEDDAFLFAVYAGTRADELASVGWSDAHKDAFLRMQFAAQRRHYQARFPDATFDVVLSDGVPVGRLYVDRRIDELLVVDIALLPAARGGGIGSALLSALLAEGARDRKPVRIHVERFNRALALYRRLGFATVADDGVYLLLESTPAATMPRAQPWTRLTTAS